MKPPKVPYGDDELKVDPASCRIRELQSSLKEIDSLY